MIYSYKNQFPTELPNRIRLPDGSTRTPPLSTEDLALAGYVEAPLPPVVNYPDKLLWRGDHWLIATLSEQEQKNEWQKIKDIINSKLFEIEKQLAVHARYQTLGVDSGIDTMKLDIYARQLVEVLQQTDPFNITWPVLETEVKFE